MTKDDALRIALSALLDCTYDERMRAIGAGKALEIFVWILAGFLRSINQLTHPPSAAVALNFINHFLRHDDAQRRASARA